MIRWLKGLVFGRDLEDVLNETKRVKIGGIRFIIKKVDVLDHLGGANVLQQVYDTYKVGKATAAGPSDKKVREYFSQVFMAGVVYPKLSMKEDGPGLYVGKLFVDQDIVFGLYEQIMYLTYGKKKMT